jgi:hypothetical protein
LSQDIETPESPDQPKPNEGESSSDVKLEFIGAVEEGGRLYGAFSGNEGSFLVDRDNSGNDYSITYATNVLADTKIKDLVSKPGFSNPGDDQYEERFQKLGKEILGAFFKLVKRVPHWKMEKIVADEREPDSSISQDNDDDDPNHDGNQVLSDETEDEEQP